jgi:hypothetical protein
MFEHREGAAFLRKCSRLMTGSLFSLVGDFVWIFNHNFNYIFYHVQVKSQGGRTINDKVVFEINKDILSKQGHDQVVVIGLGDNNLRPKGLKSGFSVAINKTQLA